MKYFQIAMVVMAWFTRAAYDGRITTRECIALVTELVAVAGLDIDVDVSEFNDPSMTLAAPPLATFNDA